MPLQSSQLKHGKGVQPGRQTKLRILTQRRGWLEFQTKSCKGNYLRALYQVIEALPDDSAVYRELSAELRAMESLLSSAMGRISQKVESTIGYLQNFHPDYEPRKKKKDKRDVE